MTKMPVSPKAAVKEVQDVSSLAAKAFASMFRRPFYVRDILTQMDIVGVGSLTVVMLTGFFTGAVLTLQSSKTLPRLERSPSRDRSWRFPWCGDWAPCLLP